VSSSHRGVSRRTGFVAPCGRPRPRPRCWPTQACSCAKRVGSLASTRATSYTTRGWHGARAPRAGGPTRVVPRGHDSPCRTVCVRGAATCGITARASEHRPSRCLQRRHITAHPQRTALGCHTASAVRCGGCRQTSDTRSRRGACSAGRTTSLPTRTTSRTARRRLVAIGRCVHYDTSLGSRRRHADSR